MTNTPYKLTDNVREYFEFDIYGTMYKMRYPNGEQRKQMAEVGQRLQNAISATEKAQESGDEDAISKTTEQTTKLSEEMSGLINSLVTCDDEKAPAIEKVLEDAPSPVLRKFQDMIMTELSLEAGK